MELWGESRPIGVTQEQIRNAEFHVVRAHLSQEVRKAIQQAYRKDKFFEKISKRKQVNKNFIIYKGLMPLKQEGTMQQLCITEKL